MAYYDQMGHTLGHTKQQTRKRAQLSLRPLAVINAPCWIRTSDRLLRRQLLYPAELREHLFILTVDVRHPA